MAISIELVKFYLKEKRMNYKKILENIKAKYKTRDQVFEFFERQYKIPSRARALGLDGIEDVIDYRYKKVKVRPEKSASGQPMPGLEIYDFGGEKHDVISLIEDNNKKLGFVEAVKLLAKWENEELSELEKREYVPIKKVEEKKVPPYKKFYLDQRIQERNEIGNNQIFNELLKGLFRSCSRDEKIAGVKAFNIGLTSYEEFISEEDEKKELIYRLFIPEYNEKGVAFGCYKYNRAIKGKKGLLRKNAQRVLFGSHLLKFYKDKSKPIILSEGHSDVVVNVAKYLQCVTNGSSTKSIKEYLPLLKGRTLHIYPDADQAGIKGATMRTIEIETFNKTIQKEEDKIKYKVFLWSSIFIDESVEEFRKCKIKVSSVKKTGNPRKFANRWWMKHFTDETLSPYIDHSIMIKEQKLIFDKQQVFQKETLVPTKDQLIENWTILSKEPVKQGFDFVDFHEKNKNSKNYENFISKYKFK